jgi:hypothetical protein
MRVYGNCQAEGVEEMIDDDKLEAIILKAIEDNITITDSRHKSSSTFRSSCNFDLVSPIRNSESKSWNFVEGKVT